MSDPHSNSTQTSLVAMTTKKLLFIIMFGAISGLVTWGLTFMLDAYIYKAILCGHNAAIQCSSSYQYAVTTATIIGTAIGLLGLVRLHVYRPLLIIIASFISLWGLMVILRPLSWYAATFSIIGLYGFAFGFFAWLARIRSFYIALILVIATIVVLRLLLNS